MSDSTAEDKVTISKEELNKLVERKIQRKISEDSKNNGKVQNSKNGINRRDFLKKIGAGLTGIGLISLPGASALNVKSDGFSFYGGQGSSLDLNVDNSGNLILYGDIEDSSGTTIWDSSNDSVPSAVIDSSGFAEKNIGVQTPVYASKSDVPSSISEGEIVYISGDGLYVEDGT